MPLDLMNLPAEEAERLAYAEGFTGTAELFARVARLEQACREANHQIDLGDLDMAQCVLSEVLR
jgi:hypothetical protein